MSLVTSEDRARELADQLFRLDPAAHEDRYPIYAALRQEAPVHRWGPMTVVARYEDVKQALRNTEALSSGRASGSVMDSVREGMTPEQLSKLERVLANDTLWLVKADDPEHARLQRFVTSTFARPRILQMRDRVQRITDALLDDAEGSNPGSMELMEALAFQLPLLVVCDLLGADVEDSAKIKEWSDQIAVAISTEYQNIDAVYEAILNFEEYIGQLIERGRAVSEPTDLFQHLVATTAEGEHLTDTELVAMFTLLLFAGHETTTNLIANATVELLRHPDQLALLRDDPDRIGGAIDEFLRYCTSVHAIHRVATRDLELGGFPVKKGETVRLLLASANHDETAFETPERLDITRKEARRHLGMGYGIHTCLGIWLARLEVDVAITTLLRRYPNMKLVGEVEHAPGFTLYGPKAVNLTY